MWRPCLRPENLLEAGYCCPGRTCLLNSPCQQNLLIPGLSKSELPEECICSFPKDPGSQREGSRVQKEEALGTACT